MILTFRRLTLVILGILIAITFAACSDNGGVATTTAAGAGADDVIFGSGDLPETIPAEFPLPSGSVVGTTMVVASTGFTEVIVRVNADSGTVAEFFDQELLQAGFNVTGSSDEGDVRLFEFSQASAKGTIDISEPQPGISQAVVRYNVP